MRHCTRKYERRKQGLTTGILVLKFSQYRLKSSFTHWSLLAINETMNLSAKPMNEFIVDGFSIDQHHQPNQKWYIINEQNQHFNQNRDRLKPLKNKTRRIHCHIRLHILAIVSARSGIRRLMSHVGAGSIAQCFAGELLMIFEISSADTGLIEPDRICFVSPVAVRWKSRFEFCWPCFESGQRIRPPRTCNQISHSVDSVISYCRALIFDHSAAGSFMLHDNVLDQYSMYRSLRMYRKYYLDCVRLASNDSSVLHLRYADSSRWVLDFSTRQQESYHGAFGWAYTLTSLNGSCPVDQGSQLRFRRSTQITRTGRMVDFVTVPSREDRRAVYHNRPYAIGSAVRSWPIVKSSVFSRDLKDASEMLGCFSFSWSFLSHAPEQLGQWFFFVFQFFGSRKTCEHKPTP